MGNKPLHYIIAENTLCVIAYVLESQNDNNYFKRLWAIDVIIALLAVIMKGPLSYETPSISRERYGFLRTSSLYYLKIKITPVS